MQERLREYSFTNQVKFENRCWFWTLERTIFVWLEYEEWPIWGKDSGRFSLFKLFILFYTFAYFYANDLCNIFIYIIKYLIFLQAKSDFKKVSIHSFYLNRLFLIKLISDLDWYLTFLNSKIGISYLIMNSMNPDLPPGFSVQLKAGNSTTQAGQLPPNDADWNGEKEEHPTQGPYYNLWFCVFQYPFI